MVIGILEYKTWAFSMLLFATTLPLLQSERPWPNHVPPWFHDLQSMSNLFLKVSGAYILILSPVGA